MAEVRAFVAVLVDCLILTVAVVIVWVVVTGGGVYELRGIRVSLRAGDNPLIILAPLLPLRYALGEWAPLFGTEIERRCGPCETGVGRDTDCRSRGTGMEARRSSGLRTYSLDGSQSGADGRPTVFRRTACAGCVDLRRYAHAGASSGARCLVRPRLSKRYGRVRAVTRDRHRLHRVAAVMIVRDRDSCLTPTSLRPPCDTTRRCVAAPPRTTRSARSSGSRAPS